MANDMSPGSFPQHFDITEFFAGATRGDGLFEDRFGRVRRQFSLTLQGRWIDGAFLLAEDFVYDDGTREQREWRIVKGHGGAFTATCADCRGVAVGASGPRDWRMRYRFRMQLGAQRLTVAFDDRVQRVDAGLAINRATVRKWGIRLGEAVIVLHKPGRAPMASARSVTAGMVG